MKLHYTNNASATLTQSINDVDTTLYVDSTALFPQGVDFVAGDGFYVTLENSMFGIREVCWVVGMTVNAFIVVRGQDGTTAQAFDSTTTVVERRAVAADYDNFVQAQDLDDHVADVDPHPQYAATADITSALDAHVAAGDPHPVYATDAALTAAIAAHVALADPHTQYSEAADVAAAIAAHVALANPHSQYSTNAYVTTAVANHAAASNPHPAYLKAASNAEITAKTSATVGLTPSTIDHLWGRLFLEKAVSTSGGAGSSGKFPLLDSTGKLDVSFLPALGGTTYKGTLDAVNNGPPAITHFAGDFYFHNGEDGNLDTDWTGVGGDPIALGDQLVYDGGNWAIIPTVIDTDQYLRRDGTVGMLGDLDVNSNAILNASIDYDTNEVVHWHSVVPGARPAGGTRETGELFINLTDRQLGVIDAGTAALDLLPITTFTTSADYATGALVVYSGSVYRALTSVTAGAFNAAQWKEITTSSTGVTEITQSAHGFTSTNVGAPLRFNGTSWVLAQATSSNHHHAVLVGITGVDSFTIASGGSTTVNVAVNGGAVLVPGTLYYVSTTTAGQVTSTPPGDLKSAHPVFVGLTTGTAFLVASPKDYAQYDYVDATAAAAAAAAVVGLASETYVGTAVSTSAALQVNKSGDTMTGALTVTDATADGHALNRITADGRFAPLSHSHSLADITGDGTMAAVNDAPSDNKTYGRYNGAWAEIVSGGEGGTSDHTQLINRSIADQHPISAITGLQTALNAKQDTITGGASTIAAANLTATRTLISDATGKVAVSSVSSTSLSYLNGVTGAIQTQLDAKLPLAGGTLTGNLTLYADPSSALHAASKNYVDGKFAASLTPSMAMVTDASGKAASHAAVSATELGYLDGVTSAIQTQLDAKQALDADLTAIGALTGATGLLRKTALNTWSLDTATYSVSGHNHDASYAALGHNHDAAYSALGHNHDAAYSALGHTHDDRYYTESEIGTLLSGYSTTSHNHDSDYISVVGTPTAGNFPTLTAGGELANSAYGPSSFATPDHNHDSAYQPLDNDLSDIAALAHAKGKIMVSDGTDWVTLAAGTNSYVLTADSTQTTGVKWASAAGGGGGATTFDVTWNSHGLTSSDIGTPVNHSGSVWRLADGGNSRPCHALVAAIVDTNTLTLQTDGILTNIGTNPAGGTLSAGQIYNLKNVAGDISTTNYLGSYITQPVLYATGTDSGIVFPAGYDYVKDSGFTMDGDIEMNNNDITAAKMVGFYAEHDNGNSGTADTITLTNGMKQKSTLTGNATLTITATSALTGHYQLRLIQDATGGRAVTWSGISSTQWLGSTGAPAINTAANGQTIINIFVVAGTVICASAAKVGAA